VSRNATGPPSDHGPAAHLAAIPGCPPRYLLLGVTSGGRHAALVFTRRGDNLRPISCRAMRKSEKEVYDAAT
jgi:uncharacterized DUF497 family protein